MIESLLLLEQIHNLIENDSSSLLYKTRCYDAFLFDFLLRDEFTKHNLFMIEKKWISCYYRNSLTVNVDWFIEQSLDFLVWISSDRFYLFFNFLIFEIMALFGIQAYFDIISIFYNDVMLAIAFIVLAKSNNNYLNFFIKQVDLIFDVIVLFDITLILFELNLCLVVIIFIISNFRLNVFFLSYVYNNIIFFLKKNNLSFVELFSLLTIFIFLFFLDIFLSFVEDDFIDSFFFIILIFTVSIFFLISVGIDISYFFMINGVGNNYISLRVLLFDLINNFLCLLRIFFCWIRFIFYDLQLEFLDISFFYIDYSNEFDFKCINSSYSNDESAFSLIYIYLEYYLSVSIICILDLVYILIQLWVGFVKLFLATYLLWLIVDLFILRVFVFTDLYFFKSKQI